jgi:hypothetical protein
MGALMPLLLSALLDSIFIFGGHTGLGYPSREPRAQEDEGGIGVVPIVAVILLALVTVALLVWLNRREKGPGDEDWVRALKLSSVAPAALIVVIIATPLIVWAASSGGDEKSLIVERGIGLTGAPELIVSLGEDDLNTLETTNGKRTVRLECLGREGQVVLDAKQKWPFTLKERGFDYPHAHQKASREQLQRADRCRLRGTRVRLEADVEGRRLAG